MIPPWKKYPDIHRFSIGWRMGRGEDYYEKFFGWFKALPAEDAERYARQNPEFEEWQGFYTMIRDGVRPSKEVMQLAIAKARFAAERRKAKRRRR